ncbi:MAG: copper chaperone PCu(A)C [Hyphomicrobiales bacterium]
MYYLKSIILAFCVTVFVTGAGSAHEYEIGDIVIEHPFSRATPPKARVAGGYMTITNKGALADRLISGSAIISKRVEIHEMAIVDDIMRMRPLPDGIEIPAGETVTFKPGSYHIMFMGIAEPFKEGSHNSVTLMFENAGEIEVKFNIEAMNASAPAHMKNGEHKAH